MSIKLVCNYKILQKETLFLCVMKWVMVAEPKSREAGKARWTEQNVLTTKKKHLHGHAGKTK